MTLREAKKLLEEKGLEYLLRREKKTLSEKLEEGCTPETRKFLNKEHVLDSEPWMRDGKPLHLTQDDWIKKYNGAGKVMACAADYYKAAKNGDKAVADVQKDFDKSWVITSTRIFYNMTYLEAEIVHYHGSEVIKPVERKLLIPYYSRDLVKNVLGTKEGLKFMQGFFLTDDGKEEILKTLEKLSSKKANELRIWTPSQDGRKSLPQRAVSLDCSGGVFRV